MLRRKTKVQNFGPTTHKQLLGRKFDDSKVMRRKEVKTTAEAPKESQMDSVQYMLEKIQ